MGSVEARSCRSQGAQSERSSSILSGHGVWLSFPIRLGPGPASGAFSARLRPGSAMRGQRSGRDRVPSVSTIRAAYRALRSISTDDRLPRPVRWLLVFGLMPIPGPIDELALGLAVLLLFCYRRRVRQILAEHR